MLKMKNLIMVVMIMLVSVTVIAMTTEVYATGTSDDPITLNGLDITIEDTDNEPSVEINEVVENTEVTEPEVQNVVVIQPETNETSNVLPQTGVTEDITVMFFIVVCVVSAIYAYKKIKDYNA